MMKTILFTITITFAATACATRHGSITLGLGVGTIIGGVAGAAAGAPDKYTTRAALAGAALGAAVGGLAGYLKHKEDEEKKLEREVGQVFPDKNAPFVTKPVVKRVWVPDKIEDNVLIRGHWQYVIVRPSTWSKPEGTADE